VRVVYELTDKSQRFYIRQHNIQLDDVYSKQRLAVATHRFKINYIFTQML